MKKFIFLILLISMLVLLVSCNENTTVTQDDSTVKNTDSNQNEDKAKTYTALEFGLSDSYLSGANHKEDVELRKTSYSAMARGTSKSINVLETEYNAKYDRSKKEYYYNQNIDYFEDTTKEYGYEFGINQNTGRVDKCLLFHNNYLETKDTSPKLSEEECKNLAVKILGQYVNVDEYNLQNTQKSFYTTGGRYETYIFTFTRIINDIETKDQAYIEITEYGDLIQYIFTCLGEMKDAVAPNADEISAIDKCIDEKIASIYSNVSEKYNVEYEIRHKYFVKLEDGKYAMEYIVDVDVTSKNTEEMGFTEKISLLVYV